MKSSSSKVSRAGTYVIKDGETRSNKVVGKIIQGPIRPTPGDSAAARTLIKSKRS